MNPTTHKFDVNYTTHRFVNKALDGGTLDKLNPGLKDEVTEHEQGHVEQYDESIKKVYRVYTGLDMVTKDNTGKVIKTVALELTGQVDQILDKAAAFYENHKNDALKGQTKDAFIKKIFEATVLQMSNDMESKATPRGVMFANPDIQPLETDANARATKALKARKIKPEYINGKTFANTGSGAPINIGGIIRILFKPKPKPVISLKPGK